MTETLLIVDPDTSSQRAAAEALRAGRYRTITANGFARGRQLLEMARPDLLITVVRLGKFNGVQLVVLGRASDTRLSALVVDDKHDVAIEREAFNAGAIGYLVKPIRPADLLARVAAALAGRERRWFSRTPLASNVVVGLGPESARLLDVGYGGFRFESLKTHHHSVLKLDLPILGLSVHAQRVWAQRTPAEGWWCGAALVAPMDSEATRRWRRLVDTLKAGAMSRTKR
jgi:DNA-binding response OmpR family regulator